MSLAARHNANVFGRFNNNENKDVRAAGKMVTRAQIGTRAALGALTNKVSNLALNAGLPKEGKLQKSKGLSDLKAIDKENAGAVRIKKEAKREVKQEIAPKKETKEIDLKKSVKQEEPRHEAFSRQMLGQINNIDANDRGNPQLVTEYVNDIYQYMRHLEDKYAVKPRYLEGSEINGRMRAILVDWLVQVHTRFNLLQETLYLAVAILDRFLQVNPVPKSKLQLIGVTAMLLASKYEEMYAPEVGDFEYITDNAYTKSEIRKAEVFMLKALDFNLGKPLALHFLRRNSKAGDVDANKHMLAKYLIELTIIDYEMVHHKPSEIAAAALNLSMKIYDLPWGDTLTHYSTYSDDFLKPIVSKIANLAVKAHQGKLLAVYDKYYSSKFNKVSAIAITRSSKVNDIIARCSSSS
ncbi:G2/mitotic-specific cyclin-B-like [Tubulanus polymorphus]|uniref:G2/mitotic-specific cyclin-B-like n=1 Tax=Tubulanus polymorphus TaxID=672921 RepID=UPI003DA45D33